ncbi:MAG: glycosyltransferase [Candidatus Bathyarchaeia archaeon]
MFSMLSPIQAFIFLTSLITALIVCLFGLNTYVLLYFSRKHGKNSYEATVNVEEWPFVTVQIATFNEKNVIKRTLENCINLDYPPDKLEIVIVDDSTDETTELLKEFETLHYPRIKVIHRLKREGYKAGALNEALKNSKGEFLLILDADTLPDRKFLKETIPYFFKDKKLGFVQGKIEYVNVESSWLAKSLSLANDWFVSFSQPALSKGEMFLCFVGHGGVFRRTAIEEAGGWESNTVSEDMDLSHRIQIKGWKALFTEKAKSKEETPPSFQAAITRYNRHIKGPIQNLWKHGSVLLREKGISTLKKSEALIQMAYPLSYLLGLLCVFFSVLTHLFVPNNFSDSFWFSPLGVMFSIFMLATFPYVSSMVSPCLSLILILVLSPVFVFWAIKKGKNKASLNLRSLLGVFLIWNDNMLTGTKAIVELLVKKEITWIPTPKIGDGTRTYVASKKTEKNKIYEALLRIASSISIIFSFIIILLKNFSFNAVGMLIPATLWLISAYLILNSE